MENMRKKFEIKHEFTTYSVDTPLSEVQPIEDGGYDPEVQGVNLETLIEFPLLEAVKSFNEKGIKTLFSSANKKDIEIGEVYITLDYDSLNEANKKTALEFSDVGSSHGSTEKRSVKISVPTHENMTVGDVIMSYREILNKFEDQNIKENTEPIQNEIPIEFEKIQKDPNTLVYVFPNVGVAIDSSGKNYERLPELLFGTYNEEISEGSMNKPEVKQEGVDMSKVVEYIKIAAKDSGINEFWIYPYADDVDIENKESRKEARMRLFGRYTELIPDENNFGYIVKL